MWVEGVPLYCSSNNMYLGWGGVAKVATVERVCGDGIHVAYYFDVAEWEA